ncbi:Holliday junction resolvase RecU [Vagococcus fluvialis]|uniref:Holliday junction resolvase RecU n=1 Tax=Vagococcus fluvialis TaxID=2738 RepID=A0A430A100_9ENTE|nr:Holliday junction resolvase RecU [Vagococcus fluvialis]MDR2278688.1 Holliday junction resolvase RecU [Vagococcus sp.]MBO0429396.1 Holliday junction resolvase RecU [Vagococcus fluvialis]MBO0442625.1 Holliday junction resolvase RecU [Vagococcus fluvialis]MBO0478046.1 Holliday junction resolvase RecU [Vagococcus fluvialis]MBO0483245.1 Holliday junction resolvase RecU [Vagococcus fluvialis]
MRIKYPNGTSFNQGPNKKKKPIDFANRGMSFEAEINQTNQYYLDRNIAVIHKKPTPVQIVKVDYPKRSAAVIKEAYFKEASTTDYNGIYNGRYIDFEAKETKNKTSFPLSNFHEHQIIHMENCLNQKGIVFVLLFFSSNKEYFLVPSQLVISYWKNQSQNGRKSIPLKDIKEHGYEIIPGYAPRIPYLQILDQHFFKGDYSHDK